ncbi:MAG: TolC family protein [Bacteroidales bacterium]
MFSLQKFCFLLIFPVLLWAPGHGQNPGSASLDLKKCLILALENNTKIITAQLDRERSASQLNQVEAAFYPHISASTSYQDYLKLPTQLIPGEFFGMPGELIPIQFGTQHNLGASMDGSLVLYNQPLICSYKIARKAIEMSKLSLEKSKEEVMYETAQVYFAAQAFSHQAQTLENNISKLQRLISLMQEQYSGGFVRKVDLDRVKVNISNLQTQLENYEEAKRQQIALLKFLTGLNQSDDITLIPEIESTLSISPEKLNPENYTEYRQLQQLELMADMKISESKAACLPTLAAIGQYSFQSQKNEFSSLYQKPDWLKMSFIGVSMNIPIFNGFGNYYRVSQAKIEKSQATLQKENLAKYLEVQHVTAQGKLELNLKAYDNQLENVKLAEDVFRVTQEQYGQGISPLTEVLDAETSLSAAQSALLQAQIQVRLAELDLLKSTGNLNSIIQ